MGILKKGKDFSPTEQVTSTKLDELVDNASFTNTSETSVAYTGTTGTCLQGGGLEVTSLGQLQIASSGVDNDNILDDTITSSKLSFIEDSVSTTAGKILVADGTTYDAETMSGDATIAVGGALTIATDAVTPAKTSFLGSVDTTADSTAHMLIKQSDGEYDSKTLTGDVTITQSGVTNIADDVELGGNPTTTTQAAADNSTKIATTAYVTSGIANALTGSGGIFGTIDSTADSNPKIFSKNSSGDYDSVAPSGDVSMTQAGAFTIANDAVTVAKTSFLGTVDTTDDSTTHILSKQSDGEYDSVTPSGDVTMAQDGVFTIQADAVTASKIDFIDDSLAATDGHILIADGTDFNNKAVSGDIAITNTGATTIQANAVEGTMLNSNTVDNSTIELSSDTLSVKDSGITKAKIENVANLKVLGNTSGSATAPQEVTINDTDDMSDASDTTLATSESIKAYVDTTSGNTRVKVSTYELASYTLNSDATVPLTEQADPDNIGEVSSGVISIGAGTYLIRFYGYLEHQQGTIKVEYKVNSSTIAEYSLGDSNDSGNFVKDYIHVNASGTDTVQIDVDEVTAFSHTNGKNLGITIMKLGS